MNKIWRIISIMSIIGSIILIDIHPGNKWIVCFCITIVAITNTIDGRKNK